MDSAHSIRTMERALDELRRGYGVILGDEHADLLVKAAECEPATAKGPLRLVLSAQRARYLGLGSIPRTVEISAGQETLLEPLLYAPRLDANVVSAPATPLEITAIEMVKQAGFLPAALVSVSVPDENALHVTAQDVARYHARPIELKLDNIVRLPIAIYEDTRLAVFEEYGGYSHLAILVGRPESLPAALVRVHSSCFTGDILGSLRCDCGNQLQDALAVMAEARSGILLYLNQEGRGIGLVNKLRAYRLQEEGLDTVDANLALGFAEDERDFAVAARMLQALGVKKIRLLTNNPQKIEVLERNGIAVTERVPLVVQPGKHNRGYLETKEKRLGHQH